MTDLQLKLEEAIYNFENKPNVILTNPQTMFELASQLFIDADKDESDKILPHYREAVLYPEEIQKLEYKNTPIYRSQDIKEGFFKVM